MAVFPRTIKPRTNSTPVLPGPFFSKSDSGKIQTRSRQRIGWTWTEDFIFKWDAAGRAFIALMENAHRSGTQYDVAHQDFTLLGTGGGTPLVDGADQTGNFIDTDGWPIDTVNVLRGGDIITLAGITTVYLVRFDVTSDGSGNAVIYITPPIFAGGSPATDAPITITDSVVYTAKIASLDIPPHDAANWVMPRITWIEDV